VAASESAVAAKIPLGLNADLVGRESGDACIETYHESSRGARAF